VTAEIALLPGLHVSRETEARLRAFTALVLKWTATINLIAVADHGQLWQRHVLDSAQLVLVAPARIVRWADLGSGGGFPGIVVAALLAEFNPGARMSLVESDQRKATFLRQAARLLGLSLDVITARAETTAPLQADVLTARALAKLTDLMPLAERHLATGGTALFPKGRTSNNEIAAARAHWAFDLQQTPSMTDASATILGLQRITRA